VIDEREGPDAHPRSTSGYVPWTRNEPRRLAGASSIDRDGVGSVVGPSGTAVGPVVVGPEGVVERVGVGGCGGPVPPPDDVQPEAARTIDATAISTIAMRARIRPR
jgi:hypothetical protein